jgi:hypothetical protein
VVRVHELGVLNLFEALHFGLDYGVGGVGIDRLGCHSRLDPRLALLLRTDFRASAGLGTKDLSSEDVGDFLG